MCRFACGAFAGFQLLAVVLVLFYAADVSLVCFHYASQQLAILAV